jgi:FlaA1/EpsC-like NDP-sugar epimerase
MAESTLKKFYKDKTIFITGGSGFMGKVCKKENHNFELIALART